MEPNRQAHSSSPAEGDSTPTWSVEAPPQTPAERLLDHFIHTLILYSVIMLFVEVAVVRSSNSWQGPPFFLWSERVVAVIFTVEYFYRWYRSQNGRYPLTVSAIVDALAIIPFWIGFFVDPAWLDWIRTLRILRLLRFFTHDRDMRRYLRAMAKALPLATAAVKVMGVLLLMYVFALYQMERPAQPDKFDSLGATFYFAITTLTTVGYGDLSPVTTPGRLLTMFMMFAGGAVLASFFAVITTAFVNEALSTSPLTDSESRSN